MSRRNDWTDSEQLIVTLILNYFFPPDQAIEARYADMLREEHRKGLELEELKEEEKLHQKVVYGGELDRQLEEQELKRQQQYEEFLKEKLMIDEICRKIYEEDQREAEARMERRRVTRQYIDEFLKKREEVSGDYIVVTCF